MKVHELKREKADKIKEADELLARIESGDLTAEAVEKRDAEHKALAEEINALDEQIKAAEDRHARIIKKPSNSDAGELLGGTYVSVKERFEDDPKHGYKSLKEVFLDALDGYQTGSFSAQIQSLHDISAAAGTDEHSSSNDPYGGFLVPEGFIQEMLSVPSEATPIINLARSIPMGNTSLVKIPARVDKNHATSVTGGFTVSRKAQTASASASRKELEQIELKATPLYGFSYATEELLQDSPMAVSAIIESGFREEFPSQIMREMIRGTGVGEMEGVLSSPAAIARTRTTTNQLKGADITGARKQAWRFSQCVWLANHDTYDQLVAAHVAHTNSDRPLFAPSNGVDVPDTLLGQPIFFTEYASALGAAGDLMLVDWSQYLLGTRGGFESAQSIHFRFDRAESAFRFTQRNGGACWWRSPLTPHKGANTLSPIIYIAA